MSVPYWDPAPVHIGSRYVQWPLLLWSAAGLLHHLLFIRDAARTGASPRRASELHLSVTATALLGGFGYAYATDDGTAVAVASLFGLCGLAIYALLRRWTLLTISNWIDTACLSLPWCAAVMRVGCVAEHAHGGLPSDSWLAVEYPGVARWDLALLEVLFFIVIALTFHNLKAFAPWRAPALSISYGLFRAAIAPLRDGSHVVPDASVLFLLIGLLLMPLAGWKRKECSGETIRIS